MGTAWLNTPGLLVGHGPGWVLAHTDAAAFAGFQHGCILCIWDAYTWDADYAACKASITDCIFSWVSPSLRRMLPHAGNRAFGYHHSKTRSAHHWRGIHTAAHAHPSGDGTEERQNILGQEICRGQPCQEAGEIVTASLHEVLLLCWACWVAFC